jgi:hypothetical protein
MAELWPKPCLWSLVRLFSWSVLHVVHDVIFEYFALCPCVTKAPKVYILVDLSLDTYQMNYFLKNGQVFNGPNAMGAMREVTKMAKKWN